MQTFLPYASFAESAHVLDRQRLGKQRVENLQIMKALIDPAYGWQNHPAVKMWRGFETALFDYQVAVCEEWTQIRGYKDTCLDKTAILLTAEFTRLGGLHIPRPSWLGNKELHASHRSNLLRKDEEFYRQYGWTEPITLEYVWPV